MNSSLDEKSTFSTPQHESRKKAAKAAQEQKESGSKVIGERIEVVIAKGPTGKRIEKVLLVTTKERLDQGKSIISEYSWYVGRLSDPNVAKYVQDCEAKGMKVEKKIY